MSPALSAFLRGIERRAFVFALVQCGDDVAAEEAVGRAMQAFATLSAVSPLSAWPSSFWSLLLAQPALSDGRGSEPELAGLSAGPRAALLLRMVAGLDLPHAAQVLGVGEDTYRFAMERALQQLSEADVSYAGLGRLRERLHAMVKALPEPVVLRLAARREAAGRAPTPAPAPGFSAPARARGPRLPWILLALLAVAFLATYLLGGPDAPPGDGPRALPEDAAPAPAPAEAAAPGADQVLHPDYALLAAPEAAGLAEDLAFLSWLAARAETPTEADVAAGPPPADPARPPPEADFAALPLAQRRLLVPVAPRWPDLDPATRAELQAHAAHWAALPPAEQEALVARMVAWDARPAPERAAARGAFAAWRALPPAEQDQVRRAHERWLAADAARRAGWRTDFEGQDSDQRQGWWLGPVLGPDAERLRSLFAFVPEEERPALLDLLRALPAPARDALWAQARRLPEAERAALRDALLAAPPAEREALLRGSQAQ